jgi:hypothetical protein
VNIKIKMKYLAVLFAIWVIAPCCLAAGCDGDCGGDTCYEGTEDSFLDCFSCSGTNYIYMGHDDIYGACFEDVEKCDDGNMPRDSTNQICYDGKTILHSNYISLCFQCIYKKQQFLFPFIVLSNIC